MDWHGCYNDSWRGLIVSEAFAHPAKFARGLIERIIEYGLSEGYWKKGDLIGDPMCGIGTGGIIAASRGLRWVGVELEERFVDLARQNFELHRHTWETMGDPLPVVIQGDAREFCRLVGECEAVITSPPWVDQQPSQANQEWHQARDSIGPKNSLGQADGYGTTPGQIGNLPASDLLLCSACGKIISDIRRSPVKTTDPGGIPAKSSRPNVQPPGSGSQAEIESCKTTAKTVAPSSEDMESRNDASRVHQKNDADKNRDAPKDKAQYCSQLQGPKTQTGKVEENGGEAAGGHSSDSKHSKGTDSGVSSAASQQSSLTISGQAPQMGSGTIPSATCNPFADPVTPKSISLEADAESPLCAECAAALLLQGQPTPLFVQSNADAPGGERKTGSEARRCLKEGTLDAAITSPPFAASDQPCASQTREKKDYHAFTRGDGTKRDHQMQSEGNVANLKEGTLDGAITSPPFRDARSDTTRPRPPESMNGELADKQGRIHRLGACECGNTEGQIDKLPTGTLDGAVTSPPFDKQVNSGGGKVYRAWCEQHGRDPDKPNAQTQNQSQQWGNNADNLGNTTGETYWQAMRQVYSQMHAALKPGGVAAIVLKDYVKAGKRVPLCDNTCTLLEAVGFTVFERTRAWLVTTEEHPSLFGGTVAKVTERKSFFRRLAEKKGSPRIDFEEVLWCRTQPTSRTSTGE